MFYHSYWTNQSSVSCPTPQPPLTTILPLCIYNIIISSYQFSRFNLKRGRMFLRNLGNTAHFNTKIGLSSPSLFTFITSTKRHTPWDIEINWKAWNQSYLAESGNCSAKSSLNLEYFSNVRICVRKSTFQACSKILINRWLQDIKSYAKHSGDGFPYPIIADEDRELAVQLGMLDPVEKDKDGLPLTCRAVFVIGPDKKLRLSLLYPATTGRNFE